MADKLHTGAPLPGRGTRIAWLISCLVPLVFVAVMLLAPQPSDGAGAVPPRAGAAAEPEAEEESGEWEGWEEEGEGEEWEEGEEGEAEAGSTPSECLLRSVNAHAVTKDQKLKLTIGYTTYEPVKATIEIRQGATRIGTFKRHLGKSGVLRLTSNLREKHTKGVGVRIHLSRGEAGCPSRRLVLFPH